MLMEVVQIGRLLSVQLLTQPIFLILQITTGFGLPRLMLAIVALRGLSTSATAIRTSTVRAIAGLFGWCVDDSVFPFCLVTLTGKPTLTLDDFWIY